MSITEFELLSRTFGAVLFGTILRSSLLAMIAAFVMLFFRSRTAELRHLIWSGVLYGLLILPVLQVTAPPLFRSSHLLSNVEMAILPVRISSAAGKDITVKAISQTNLVSVSQPFPWILVASEIYIAITLILLVRLMLSLLQLRRIVRRSEPILDADLQQLRHDIWLQRFSSVKPQIRVSSDVCVPIAAGINETSILLPFSWTRWQPDKLRAVLAHEMAHVRRRDPATAFFASLAVCLFWLHPLAYGLRRKLAALAEETCDETALRFVKPEQYSRILLEFAADVATVRNRLLAAASVAVHRSQIEKRIERMFSFTPDARTTSRSARILLAAVFVPTLYLVAAVPLSQERIGNGPGIGTAISIANTSQARELEADLRRHPGNLSERGALMSFYANKREEAAFTKHLLWMIDRHPDSPLAAMKFFAIRGQENPSGDRERVKAAWEPALARHSNSGEVLYHAGLCFEEDNPQRALALFRQAKNTTLSEPEAQLRYLQSIALIYVAAATADLNPGNLSFRINGISMPLNLARTLRTELETSDNSSLLSQVGTVLVQIGGDRQTRLGFAFLRKAIELDPSNPHWKEALETAKAEPVRRRNRREMARELSQRRSMPIER